MEVSGASNELGQDQFLQLLVSQLKNQDPLEPIKDQEFIAQLTQFSTLDQIQQLNTSFSDMLTLTQLTQGANLIGRTVSFQQAGAVGPSQATVEALNLVDGRVQFVADGQSIPLDNVLSVL